MCCARARAPRPSIIGKEHSQSHSCKTRLVEENQRTKEPTKFSYAGEAPGPDIHVIDDKIAGSADQVCRYTLLGGELIEVSLYLRPPLLGGPRPRSRFVVEKSGGARLELWWEVGRYYST